MEVFPQVSLYDFLIADCSLWRTFEYLLARAEYHDPVRDAEDDPYHMFDDHHRDTESPDPRYQSEGFFHLCVIQSGKNLVEEQELRPRCQCTCYLKPFSIDEV